MQFFKNLKIKMVFLEYLVTGALLFPSPRALI